MNKHCTNNVVFRKRSNLNDFLFALFIQFNVYFNPM